MRAVLPLLLVLVVLPSVGATPIPALTSSGYRGVATQGSSDAWKDWSLTPSGCVDDLPVLGWVNVTVTAALPSDVLHVDANGRTGTRSADVSLGHPASLTVVWTCEDAFRDGYTPFVVNGTRVSGAALYRVTLEGQRCSTCAA